MNTNIIINRLRSTITTIPSTTNSLLSITTSTTQQSQQLYQSCLYNTTTRFMSMFKRHSVRIAVTLTEDINKLGYKDQTVYVARGYARNVLVKNNKAYYTYIKTDKQSNHKKIHNSSSRQQLKRQSNDSNDNQASMSTTTETTQHSSNIDIEQRRWFESLKSILEKCTIKSIRQADTTNNKLFTGRSIDNKYIYSTLQKLYPDIATQLYIDRILLSQPITQFGTYKIPVSLYPALNDVPVEIKLDVVPRQETTATV